jgi:hypothetical protein
MFQNAEFPDFFSETKLILHLNGPPGWTKIVTKLRARLNVSSTSTSILK